MDAIAILELIDNLNTEIYEQSEVTDCYKNKITIAEEYGINLFEYCSNGGWYETVTFMDIIIWNSDCDDRKYDEEKDEYEPLESFLRRKANQLISDISKIKL